MQSVMFRKNIFFKLSDEDFVDSRRKLRQHERAVTGRDKKRIISLLESTPKPELFEFLYSAHHTQHH